jgi:acyl-CoA thioester hydrolase
VLTPYKKEIVVTTEDIDGLNHVNNVRYVQWIQDISVEHWYIATKNKLSKEYIWVVASHYIEYKRSAVLYDKLIIETYVKDFEGSLSHRVVNIKNSDTGKAIVKALTKWCLVDQKTQRPLRIPDEILNVGL